MSRAPAATTLRLGLAALGLAFVLIACPGPVPPGQSELEPQPPGAVVPVPDPDPVPEPDPDPTPDPEPDPEPEPVPPIKSIAWSPAGSASMTRSEGQSGVVGGKLYVLGGFAFGSCEGPTVKSEVLDPAANTWTPIRDMPKRLSHVGTAAVERSIYLAGGYIGTGACGWDQQFATTDVWRYDVDANTYSAVTPLPQARGSGALVYAGGKLHFFGGVDSSRADRGEHWILSPVGDGWANSWTPATPLPNPRSHMGYASLNDKVYAIGGQHGTDEGLVAQRSVHVWDPAQPDRWTELEPMPLGRSHTSSATIVAGGRILVIGGEKAHTHGVNNVSSYDPATNKWTELTPLPHTRHSGVAGYIGGNIYYATGAATADVFKGVPTR